MSRSDCNYDRASLIVARLISEHCVQHPQCRATRLVKLVKNSSATKQYGCVLCGVEGPTFSGRWPETKASARWCETHSAGHIAEMDAQIQRERFAVMTAAELVAHDARIEERHDEASEIVTLDHT